MYDESFFLFSIPALWANLTMDEQEALERGEDYERKQFWGWSAESVEEWEEKMKEKAARANIGFTGNNYNDNNRENIVVLLIHCGIFLDHQQEAHKKYIKLISHLKPDMQAYAEKKMESIERAIRNGEDPSDVLATAHHDLDYGSPDDKPSKEAVDRLVADVTRQYVSSARSIDP